MVSSIILSLVSVTMSASPVLRVVAVLMGGVTPGSHLSQQILVGGLMNAISALGGTPAYVAFECSDYPVLFSHYIIIYFYQAPKHLN